MTFVLGFLKLTENGSPLPNSSPNLVDLSVGGSPVMLRILVVDDSKLSRSMAVRAVASMGHSTIEAAHGLEALDLLPVHEPDVVLTDLLMPEMNGFELIEQVRLVQPHLPVIVVSADVQVSSRERGRELGCVAFLRKPVNANELASVLHNLS
jgi:CheY-like chemotaxis protein